MHFYTCNVGNHSNYLSHSTDTQSHAYHSYKDRASQEEDKYANIEDVMQEDKNLWNKHTKVCFSDLLDLVDLRLLSNIDLDHGNSSVSRIHRSDLVRSDLTQSVAMLLYMVTD